MSASVPELSQLLGGAPFAHRGLHDASRGVPENSLAAMRAAVDAGFGIELDVRRGPDETVIVFHDVDLSRLADEKVGAHERDPRTVRLLGTGEHIPTLGEVLDLVAGRVPVLVELKGDGPKRDGLEEAVHAVLADYDGPFTVMSFAPAIVTWFAEHEPDWWRGQLSAGRAEDPHLWGDTPEAAAGAWRNWSSRPHYLSHYQADLPFAPLQAARAEGLPVLTWTVRSARRWAAIAGEVDNIIFEGFDPRDGQGS